MTRDEWRESAETKIATALDEHTGGYASSRHLARAVLDAIETRPFSMKAIEMDAAVATRRAVPVLVTAKLVEVGDDEGEAYAVFGFDDTPAFRIRVEREQARTLATRLYTTFQIQIAPVRT